MAERGLFTIALSRMSLDNKTKRGEWQCKASILLLPEQDIYRRRKHKRLILKRVVDVKLYEGRKGR